MQGLLGADGPRQALKRAVGLTFVGSIEHIAACDGVFQRGLPFDARFLVLCVHRRGEGPRDVFGDLVANVRGCGKGKGAPVR